MTEVLDTTADHGIDVILRTSTYAVPPWLARAHPGITDEVAIGRRRGWGARQEAVFTHRRSGATQNG